MDHAILIHALRNGKEDGLIGIYRLYNKPLLFFARKYVKDYQIAEEIVSDVFVKVWERRSNFHSLDNVRAFLYIATKNRCLNQLRVTNIYETMDELTDYEELLFEDAEAFTKIVHTELIKAVFKEVERLPKKQREVFNKLFLEDKTIEETCKELNMAPQAVYTSKSRALAILRQRLRLRDALYLLVLAGILYFF